MAKTKTAKAKPHMGMRKQARLAREQIAKMDDCYLVMFLNWARRAAEVGNPFEGTDGFGYTEVSDFLYPGRTLDEDGITVGLPEYAWLGL